MRLATEQEWSDSVYEALELSEINRITAWVRPQMASVRRSAWWRNQPPEIRLRMIEAYRKREAWVMAGHTDYTFAQACMGGL